MLSPLNILTNHIPSSKFQSSLSEIFWPYLFIVQPVSHPLPEHSSSGGKGSGVQPVSHPLPEHSSSGGKGSGVCVCVCVRARACACVWLQSPDYI